MRTVEILQVIGALVGSFASIAISMENFVIKYFQKENAISSETATKMPDYTKIKKWRTDRLIIHGVLKCTKSNKYFYDNTARTTLRKKRLMIVIPSVLIFIGIVLLLHLI
ncbi:MAG: hypothetical protein KKA84_04955 [Bacteroidetes bacterium]|nr:hypothetical protein [Bacteroidota bacterium]